jgi:hypothetical protein
MKLLTTQFSPASCYFACRAKYYLQHPVLELLRSMSARLAKDPYSTFIYRIHKNKPIKTGGNITAHTHTQAFLDRRGEAKRF